MRQQFRVVLRIKSGCDLETEFSIRWVGKEDCISDNHLIELGFIRISLRSDCFGSTDNPSHQPNIVHKKNQPAQPDLTDTSLLCLFFLGLPVSLVNVYSPRWEVCERHFGGSHTLRRNTCEGGYRVLSLTGGDRCAPCGYALGGELHG
jgi:hypothetical protein